MVLLLCSVINYKEGNCKVEIEKRTINIYIAEDGKEFHNPFQCAEYEENISKIKRRKEFLNKIIIEEMKKISGIIEWPERMSLEEQAKWIDGNLYIECNENDTEIGYLTSENGEIIREEFDENCPFDITKWWEFEEEINIKYGYNIKDSVYYWAK